MRFRISVGCWEREDLSSRSSLQTTGSAMDSINFHQNWCGGFLTLTVSKFIQCDWRIRVENSGTKQTPMTKSHDKKSEPQPGRIMSLQLQKKLPKAPTAATYCNLTMSRCGLGINDFDEDSVRRNICCSFVKASKKQARRLPDGLSRTSSWFGSWLGSQVTLTDISGW